MIPVLQIKQRDDSKRQAAIVGRRCKLSIQYATDYLQMTYPHLNRPEDDASSKADPVDYSPRLELPTKIHSTGSPVEL